MGKGRILRNVNYLLISVGSVWLARKCGKNERTAKENLNFRNVRVRVFFSFLNSCTACLVVEKMYEKKKANLNT